METSINLCGITLKNPLVLASGYMGVSAASMQFVEKNGAGAVTMKSIGPYERKGHANPTIYSWEYGIANAVGLSNPGIDHAISQIQEAMKVLDIPLIISIFADTLKNFIMIAERVAALKPHMIELNLSCPNTESDFGRMFALDKDMTAKITHQVKKVIRKTKLSVKLSPDSDQIVDIAKAAEAEGADAITAINTVSGLIIDIKLRRPILANKFGGISGPSIKPIGVRAVYNIYKAVKIPIIGTGGIVTGEDAIEYIMAGATALGIGSGIYYRGIDVFRKIVSEMKMIMKEQHINNLEDIRGIAHEH